MMVQRGRCPLRGRSARQGLGSSPGDCTEANIKWFTLPPLFIFHTGASDTVSEEVK